MPSRNWVVFAPGRGVQSRSPQLSPAVHFSFWFGMRFCGVHSLCSSRPHIQGSGGVLYADQISDLQASSHSTSIRLHGFPCRSALSHNRHIRHRLRPFPAPSAAGFSPYTAFVSRSNYKFASLAHPVTHYCHVWNSCILGGFDQAGAPQGGQDCRTVQGLDPGPRPLRRDTQQLQGRRVGQVFLTWA